MSPPKPELDAVRLELVKLTILEMEQQLSEPQAGRFKELNGTIEWGSLGMTRRSRVTAGQEVLVNAAGDQIEKHGAFNWPVRGVG